MKAWTVSVTVAGAMLWAAACSSGQPEVDCSSEPGCVEAGDDVEVDIEGPTASETTPQGPMTLEYLVSGCGLAPPGACKGRKGCGHVYVSVPDCGVTAESYGGEAVVDLSQCAPGEHAIIVLLHDDAHAVLVRDGVPISRTVIVVVDPKREKKKNKHKGDCG